MIIKNLKFKIKNFVGHPLFSGSAIMVGGTMAVNILGYLYHIVMGRMLGPIDYGVLASLFSVIYLVGIIPTSASVAIVRFIAISKTKEERYAVYKTLERLVFKIALVSSTLFLLASPVIAKFLRIDNTWLVVLVAPTLFFLLVTLLNQASAQGILRFIGSVGPGFTAAVAKLVIGVLFVLIGWSVFGALVGIAAAMFLAYVYSHLFIRKHITGTQLKHFDLGPFIKYAMPVLLQALAFTSFFTVDVILAKHFLAPFEAGLYSALSTLGKIIFFAVSPVISTMFPIISERSTKKIPYKNILVLSFTLTFTGSGLIALFYYLFPELAIGFLYGKDYLLASNDLYLMGLFMFFYSLSFFLVNFALSIGNIKIVVLPLFVAAIQIPSLWIFHQSIWQIIMVNLLLAIGLFLALFTYLGYNSFIAKNEKK